MDKEKTMKMIKQVTIIFDDEDKGFDIKVFLPDESEIVMDIIEVEEVPLNDREI